MAFDSAQFMLLSLIFMRITGFIAINPILGRRNIPARAKAGFILVLSFTIYLITIDTVVPVAYSAFEYGVLLLCEFAMGAMIAFVMSMFFYVIALAGGIIDFQLGLSMARVFDPGSSANMALNESIMNIFYYLMFFAVDGHLAMIKILSLSFETVPYGQVLIGPKVVGVALAIFCECTVMGLQLAFPIIAIEFLVGIGVGILMKAIPQINIFVINIQIKLVVGVFMLIVLAVPMGEYISSLTPKMLKAIQALLTAM